jgi:hypothetical protein
LWETSLVLLPIQELVTWRKIKLNPSSGQHIMPANNTEIEKKLWDTADELRANSKLKSSEYSIPVLGLVFLCYADIKFARAEEELRAEKPSTDRGKS